MSKVETAVKWMIDKANDPKAGYDWNFRWGERGDWDCSSLTIQAFENAGLPLKTLGATYTGNMSKPLQKLGFKNVVGSIDKQTGAGLKRGDILLNIAYHVAVYIGNGKIVQASINEFGGVRGGKPGDQSGREINISNYANYHRGGWNEVWRYEEPIQNQTKKEDDEVVEQKTFIVDGKEVKINAILKDNLNYVQLHDLVKLGIIKTTYDANTKVVSIQTK